MKEVICYIYMKSCVLSLFSLFILVKFEDSLCLPSTTIKRNGMASINMLLPNFDLDMPRNLTVTVGRTGFLHCKVEGIGDKDVSWIRKRDLHILTTGTTTYTSDQRFQVIRPDNSGNWILQIKYPQPRDSGIYECQINTEPKLSLSYMFNVIELQARILGSTDLYVKTGSDINLICKVPQNPDEIGNVYWYKGNEIIEQTASQGVYSGLTRASVENEWRDEITSRLEIKKALPVDTGNYTCVPTLAKPCSAYVHIIISEHPAAIQRNLGVKSNAIVAKSVLHICLLTIPYALLYTIEDVYLGFFKNMKLILFNEIKLE